MPQTLRTLYLKSTAVAGIAKIFLALAGVITVWQLNYILDKDSFGAFMIVFSLAQVIAATVSTCFQSLILYHVPEDNHQDRETPHPIARAGLGYAGLLSFLIGGLFFCAAPFLAGLFNKPELTVWFTVLAGFIPAFTLNMVLTGWQRAKQNIVRLTLYNEILPASLRIAGLAALGFLPVSPLTFWLIGGLHIASYLLPFVILYGIAPLPPSLNWAAFSGWDMRYALQSGFGQLINKSTRNLVVVMSGFLASTAVTADFAIATRFGQLLLIPKNALVQLLTPRIRTHLKSGNKKGLINEFRATQSIMLSATLCGVLAYMLFAKPVLGLFGDYGQQAYDILIILSIASMIRAAFGDAGGYIAMAGYAGWTLLIHALSFIVLLAGFVTLVPAMGGIGASYATNIAVLVSILAVAVIIKAKEGQALIGWPESLTLLTTSALIAAYVHTPVTLPVSLAVFALITSTYIFIRIKSALRVFSLIKNT